MIERLEAERLANAIHSLRPDWPLTSLLTFLHAKKNKPLLELTVQLAWVAQLPDSKTPARVDFDGPWRRAFLGAGVQSAPAARYPLPDDCAVCGGPRVGTHADHEYREPLPPESWARPTPEQRAALEAARVQAEKQLTAAQEVEPERTKRDPAEVIAAHTNGATVPNNEKAAT